MIRETIEGFKFELFVCVTDGEGNSLIPFSPHPTTGGDITIESVVVRDEVTEFEVDEWCEFALSEGSAEICEERYAYF